MADFIATVDRDRLEEKAEDEDESWEDEVNMDVFYTDAAKYWKVREVLTLFRSIYVCVTFIVGGSGYSRGNVGWIWTTLNTRHQIFQRISPTTNQGCIINSW